MYSLGAILILGCNASLLRRVLTDGETPTGIVDDSTISDCTWWVNVDGEETCNSIADYYGTSVSDLVKYNPSLKDDCSGLTSGHSYCIEENHGLGPLPTSTPTASTPIPPTKTTTNTPTGPSPTQSGVASNCTEFYKVAKGDSCQVIVDKYGTFTLSDFYSWNPAVGKTCLGLQKDVFVCVGVPGTPTARPTTTKATTTTGGPTSAPSPIQTGIISSCTKYYKVEPGDSCQDIADANNISLSDFYSWNKFISNKCDGLWPDYNVCVGVAGMTTTTAKPPMSTKATPTGPSPTQSGITSDCAKFYKAVKGDSCWSIADHYGSFTEEDFERWNPAVGDDCSHLWTDYYYCIWVPGTPKPTATTTIEE